MRTLEISSEQYRLEYDINAGCDMEDRAGRTIDKLIDTSLTSIRLILWGGLRKHHPEITLADAGDLISAHGDRAELMNLCFEEMKLAGFFGKAAEEPPKKKQRQSEKSTQP